MGAWAEARRHVASQLLVITRPSNVQTTSTPRRKPEDFIPPNHPRSHSCYVTQSAGRGFILTARLRISVRFDSVATGHRSSVEAHIEAPMA